MALSIRPRLKYTRLMETNTASMTKTITLELTPYQEDMLLDALNSEVIKWLDVKCDIQLGKRPNASYEGADMLHADAKALREKIKAVVRKY